MVDIVTLFNQLPHNQSPLNTLVSSGKEQLSLP
ncbi:hypothetical protein PSFL107428_00040 [Pseudoalteromonas maricaloris]